MSMRTNNTVKKVLVAFLSRVSSSIAIAMLCIQDMLSTWDVSPLNVFPPMLTSVSFEFAGSISILLLVSLFTPCITSLFDCVFRKKYDSTIVRNIKKEEHVFFRWKKSKKVGISASGNGILPVIRVSGILTNLNDREIEAVFYHEVSHLKYFHLSIRLFVFLLIFSMGYEGLARFLFSWAMLQQAAYICEFAADRYAKKKASAGALITALEKLTKKDWEEKLFNILEYIPIVNILLVTHPPLELRKYFLGN